jgi:hypothetical protein
MTTAPHASARTCVVVTVVVFAALVAAGAATRPLLPARFRDALVATARPPGSRRYYLGYARGGVEHYVLYQDLDGATDVAKRADALFLGNSHLLFAFPHEPLRDFFEEERLRYYVMGFGYGERSGFFEAIIDKFDLRPKWMVINAEPFFATESSAFAYKVMSETRFDAVKFRFEANVGFSVRHRLHQVVPYLSPFQVTPDWIWYRSYDDGTAWVAGTVGVPAPASVPSAREITPAYVIEVARRFKADMDRRGIRLVLTCVPPDSPVHALRIGEALGVPVLVPELPDLMTRDGRHLDEDSAKRFSSAFLEQWRPLLEAAR